ncbi:MAG TPA: hypothetical protein VLM36_13710 [Sphingomicrobium sp.]|nr:hypothetical protein [Sphingomicrobium sp.]
MRLIHASIPADDPCKVAEVLAEMMEGEALPFPPAGPQARMAWSADGEVSLEIVPRGHLIHHGVEEGEWRAVDCSQRLSEVHLAIAVNRRASDIIAIADRAGWPARICSRGEGFFELVELWVEGAFMLEMFDPEQANHYGRTVTVENLKRHLAEAA